MRSKVTVSEADAIQKELRPLLIHKKIRRKVRVIAGADVSFTRGSSDLYACVVALSYPDLEILERTYARAKATFPYIPGYLSFREVPVLLKAFENLKTKVDLIMADGQGIAHPRHMGLAAHLGLSLKMPSFGVGKSKLYGSGKMPLERKGAISPLFDPKTGEEIGAIVRAKKNVAPLFVSAGHLITLQESVAYALSCARGYRIPEPTRLAHEEVNRFRRGEIGL